MLLKGRIKPQEGQIGLIKNILQKEGLKSEEDCGVLFFEEDVDPFIYNRTTAQRILEEISDLVEEAEIGAYSIVEIFRYKIKENKGVEMND